jgi:hypothetical protein
MSLAQPGSVCWVVNSLKGYTELPKGRVAPHKIRLWLKLETHSQCLQKCDARFLVIGFKAVGGILMCRNRNQYET